MNTMTVTNMYKSGVENGLAGRYSDTCSLGPSLLYVDRILDLFLLLVLNLLSPSLLLSAHQILLLGEKRQ